MAMRDLILDADLALAGERYAVHGQFGMDETATSHLMDGFRLSVTQVFTLE